MKHTFTALAKGEVNREQGIIFAVSLIEMGVAKGHNLIIDQVTLQQVMDKSQVYDNGLKVKLNHGSGVEAICGRIKNIRVLGDKCVGDFHLLKSHPRYDLILEMAELQPDTFGMSVAFQGNPEPVPTGLAARVDEIFSCDLVCEPAATEALFEEKKMCDTDQREREGKAGDDEAYLGKLSSMLDRIEVGLETAFKKKGRCWKGYEPVAGKTPYSDGSCKKMERQKEATTEFKESWEKRAARSDKRAARADKKIKRAIYESTKDKGIQTRIRRLKDRIGALKEAFPRGGDKEVKAEVARLKKTLKTYKSKAGGSGGNCGTGAGGFQPSNNCASN